jgi:hypothetical protein
MKSIYRKVATAGLLLLLAAGPARAADGVAGLWCGTGLLHEFSLDLTQPSPEEVSGTLSRKARKRELHGRLEGNILRTQSTKIGSLVLKIDGGELRIVGGDGPLALAQGMVFTRARGSACGLTESSAGRQ